MRDRERAGGTGHQGHPPSNSQAVFARENCRIVLEALRGEEPITALREREGISDVLYCTLPKEYLAAGKKAYAELTVRTPL